jgi:hypothetical protein
LRLFHSIYTDCVAILFSIMACALISGCATTRLASSDQFSAYKAAMAGNLNDARNFLKVSGNDSFSKFLLACIELSEEHLSQARRYVDELIILEPSIPEGKVLRELIEQRKAYSAESWTTSFVAAWRAAGSPRMTVMNDIIERADNEESETICENQKIPDRIISTPEELLGAKVFEFGMLCNTENFVKYCLSPNLSETPVAIKLVALKGLDMARNDSNISEDLRKQAEVRKHELTRELSQQLPRDMKFALMAILDQMADQDRFSITDIEHIEEAVSRPLLAPSLKELYDDYLTRFIALGVSNPYLNASSMAFSVNGILYFGLRAKTIATAEKESPEVRERLATILDKVGSAQLKHGTVIELLMSIGTLYSAAEIRGDKKMEERLMPLSAYLRKLVLENMDIRNAALFWPIRPLMIDATEVQMKNELGFYQLFTDADLPPVLSEMLKN